MDIGSLWQTPGIFGAAPQIPQDPSGATPLPGFLQRLNTPIGQIGLRLLANSRQANGAPTRLGQALGQAVLGYQEQQQGQMDQDLRRKYLQMQIQKMGMPDPGRPVVVTGQDGKPVYVNESDAIGKAPYEKPLGQTSDSALIQEWKQSGEPDYWKFLERRSRIMNMGSQEQLIAIQGPNGPVLVPRSQATGATPAASRETPSETELTAKNYFDRMNAAEGKLGNFVPSLLDYVAAGKMMEGGGVTGSLANSMISPQGQQYYQAAADWVRAKLRKESGAVISPAEMAQEIKTYFPMPGDGPSVIAQKAKARAQATSGMKEMGGRASKQQPVQPAANDPLGIR